MGRDRTGTLFSLEVSRDNGKLKISAYEKSSGDEKTVRHYETKDIRESEISKMCSAVVDLLNRASKKGKLERKTLEELQAAGQLLYDSLLTSQVKEKLSKTQSGNLIILVDDTLVHIPWELLYDGSSFLCHRFNMGRVVNTSQKVAASAVRKVKKPLKMLIVSDPRSDLESSYNEGVSLTRELDHSPEIIEVDMRSSQVDSQSLKSVLRDYDIFHYAGHADYDTASPSESGLLMKDGKLRASEIIDMTGDRPLPSLVFSNACKSGHTDMWQVREDFETEIFGLANAFLLAGVRHYIGTFWDVQDEPSQHFALDFYRVLVSGAMVGEAVRKARAGLIARYGQDSIIWASYMLYGDPTVRYTDLSASEAEGEKNGHAKRDDEYSREAVEVGGNVRSADAVFSLPRKNRKWIIPASIFIVTILFIVIASFLRPDDKSGSDSKHITVSLESPDLKKKRVDELVKTLIINHRERLKSGQGQAAVTGDPGIPALAFLNIKAHGMTDADKDYVLTGMTNILRNSKRLSVVERETIDTLLEELKLNSSELADPAKALEIGKILSAQLIASGSISKTERFWQISLRLIDTETTTIRAAVTETFETTNKDMIADQLGEKILREVKTEYPLKEKILAEEIL